MWRKVMSDTPEAWGDWLRSFREQFIAAEGWDVKEAKRCIRDQWVVVRGVHLHGLPGGDQRPADAILIFEVLTSGGWKRPIRIVERLTGLVTKAMTSQRAPRDIVIGLLSQIEHAEGPDESDEVLRQRHTAALWARQLLALCEHEAFSEVAGTDIFWSLLIYAIQTGGGTPSWRFAATRRFSATFPKHRRFKADAVRTNCPIASKQAI